MFNKKEVEEAIRARAQHFGIDPEDFFGRLYYGIVLLELDNDPVIIWELQEEYGPRFERGYLQVYIDTVRQLDCEEGYFLSCAMLDAQILYLGITDLRLVQFDWRFQLVTDALQKRAKHIPSLLKGATGKGISMIQEHLEVFGKTEFNLNFAADLEDDDSGIDWDNITVIADHTGGDSSAHRPFRDGGFLEEIELSEDDEDLYEEDDEDDECGW